MNKQPTKTDDKSARKKLSQTGKQAAQSQNSRIDLSFSTNSDADSDCLRASLYKPSFPPGCNDFFLFVVNNAAVPLIALIKLAFDNALL